MDVTTDALANFDDDDLSNIYALTKRGSVFRAAMETNVFNGRIAVVRDKGEIVGWCRTEAWEETEGCIWNTLEAYVDEHYRRRGVATLAAKALYATYLHDTPGAVAVFAPSMMVVARSAGLSPTMFAKDGNRWMRA
jgi:GNAT superfamily N-acetyltransferase